MLTRPKPKRILFIINPASGRRHNEKLENTIGTFCGQHDIQSRNIFLTKEIKEAEVWKEIGEFQPEIIVAAGGDGTVNFAAGFVLNTDTALCILPLGSSNALAKNLYYPKKIAEALEMLLAPRLKEIDTLKINGQLCIHLCELGFNAKLIARFQHNVLRGMFMYGLALIRELFSIRFFSYSVVTDKDRLSGRSFSITVTNTRFYGTKAAINPYGKIDDGLFEICIIKPFPKPAMLLMLWQLFRRKIHTSPYSIFLRTSEAVLENEENIEVHIDGEPATLDKTMIIRLLSKSLKILIPKGFN
jgi:YegS/Rv2252/BmrU family lipid kinase